MNISPTGRTFVEHQEWIPRSARCGWDSAQELYFPYRDYRRFWTFGPGLLIGDGRSGPGEYVNGRTEDQVDDLFSAKLSHYEDAVNELNFQFRQRHLTDMPQNCFDAWMSFAWNEGTGRLGAVGNSAVRAFLNGDLDGCAKLLLAYDVSDGQHDPNLHKRRQAEGYVMTHPYAEDHDHDDPEHRADYIAPLIDLMPVFRESDDALREENTRNDLRSLDQRQLEAVQARETLPAPEELEPIPPTDRNS